MSNTQEIYKYSRIWYSLYLKKNNGGRISVESVYIDISPECSYIYCVGKNGTGNTLRAKRRDRNFNLRYRTVIELIENYLNRDPSSFIFIIPRSSFEERQIRIINKKYSSSNYSINSFSSWLKIMKSIYESVNFKYFTDISTPDFWMPTQLNLTEFLEWIKNNINLYNK